MTKEITTKDELTEFLLYTSPNGDVRVEAKGQKEVCKNTRHIA